MRFTLKKVRKLRKSQIADKKGKGREMSSARPRDRARKMDRGGRASDIRLHLFKTRVTSQCWG